MPGAGAGTGHELAPDAGAADQLARPARADDGLRDCGAPRCRFAQVLRRRVGGDDEGWHLKLPVRKDTRQELHAPLGEGTGGSVPARLADQVKDITAGQPLHPVAILDTERTVVTLPGPSGAPLVEVADDLVTAIRFGEPDSGPMTWREIEVEALSPDSGAAAMLESVGTVLREAGARPSASGSKLARVMDAG